MYQQFTRERGMSLPACPWITMLHRLFGCYWSLKSLANLYIWWPKIYRETQSHGENCIKCFNAGKNLKHLSKHKDLGKLPMVVEPNQEIELDPPPLTWGIKKKIFVCVDRFTKNPSVHITSSTSAKSVINFLRKYITLHGITRTIRADQGSGFISKVVREFCQEQNTKRYV